MPDFEPHIILDNQLKTVQDAFRVREQTLAGYKLPPHIHNKGVAKLQAEYDEIKLKTMGLRSQLDTIKQGIEAGDIDPELGRQAMFRLVLPDDAANAMFPKPDVQQQQQQQRIKQVDDLEQAGIMTPQQAGEARSRIQLGPEAEAVLFKKPETERSGGFSPGERKSFTKEFESAIESTVVDPKGWLDKKNRKHVDSQRVRDAYEKEKTVWGYNTKSPADQRAFDQTWDQALLSDTRTKDIWKNMLAEPSIKAGRTYGNRLLGIAARKVTGVSPFAQAVQAPQSKQTARKLTREDAMAILKQAGGDKAKARQIAKQQGYEL